MIIKIKSNVLKEILTAKNAIPRTAKDEMALPTVTHSNPLIRWLWWRRYEIIAGLARFTSEMTVLEFGCGSGIFLPTMCDLTRKVYAVDLFTDYAEKLSARLGLKTEFLKEVTNVPDGSIDVIIAADVLEHIEDPYHYLQMFKVKLKDGGRLIVSGPMENFIYRLGRIAAGFAGKGDYHKTNIKDLKKKIGQSGYRLLKIKKVPFALLPSLFLALEFKKLIHR